MKRSQQCPKCQGRRFWVITQFRAPSDSSSGAPLPVAYRQGEERFLGTRSVVPVGQFDLWACAGCGYSELWAEGLEELSDDPLSGVRLVDATAPARGPFR